MQFVATVHVTVLLWWPVTCLYFFFLLQVIVERYTFAMSRVVSVLSSSGKQDEDSSLKDIEMKRAKYNISQQISSEYQSSFLFILTSAIQYKSRVQSSFNTIILRKLMRIHILSTLLARGDYFVQMFEVPAFPPVP